MLKSLRFYALSSCRDLVGRWVFCNAKVDETINSGVSLRRCSVWLNWNTSFTLLVELVSFVGGVLDGNLTVHDALDTRQDAGPVLEEGEWSAVLNAVGDEVISLLGEEEIGLTSSREVGDTVTSVEESWSLLWGQEAVWADGERLVVAEPRVVVELDFPASLVVDVLAVTRDNSVGNDVNLDVVWADKALQDGTNNWLNSGGEDNGWDVVGERPLEELVEMRVELDVGNEVVNALVEWHVNVVHLLLEELAEVHGAVEHLVVAGTALLVSQTQVVHEQVVAVLHGNGTVEVREEDVLGVLEGRVQRGELGGSSHDRGVV